VETQKEKEIMRRKKLDNWREKQKQVCLFFFFFLFSPNFFPLHEQAARTEMAARIQDNFVQKSTESDDKLQHFK
jgi:hypothetical protein